MAITEEDRKKSQATRTAKMNKKQKLFIKAYSQNYACNVSATCNAIGINRRLFYHWMAEYQDFKDAIEDAREALIDLAETKLQQNIMEGKEASIFFYLKTQAKHRGYIETVEQKVQINPFEALMQELPDEPDMSEPSSINTQDYLEEESK